jgi:hypothetical protein
LDSVIVLVVVIGLMVVVMVLRFRAADVELVDRGRTNGKKGRQKGR